MSLTLEVDSLTETANSYLKAATVLKSVGELRQEEAQQKIESLVTQGLQTVFGEELSFHIVSKASGAAVGTEFVVRTTLEDGSTVDTSVMDARGGGLAATIGFLLRLVVMLLDDSKRETLLVLDETFAHVSEDYLSRLSEFLHEVVEKTGVQILMVTHQPIFAENADKRYKFTNVNGVTKVEEI